MNDHAGGRARILWSIGATAALLTLALGSVAQTSLHADASQAAVAAPAVAASVRPTVAPRPARPPAPPLAPGFDVRAFEAMAEQLVANERVPGLAMAIVHGGEVLSARGYGVTDVRNPEPVDGHTVFRLASLSKGFAGTLAGLLVHDGALRWDSRVTEYLPAFRLRDPMAAERMTVADVLSHRVGLTHNTYDRDLERYVDYRTLTQKLAHAPMACEPGTCYGYQNIAFSLIGDVVFAATGDFYAQQVQRRLLMPLGMQDASVGLEGILASARWARPHVRGGRGWVPVMPKPTYYQVAPAAGINASASDMAQWLLAQMGHRTDVLPAPLLATLHAPLVDTPGERRGSAWRRERVSAAGYGLGWRSYDYLGHRMVFHGGAVQGYRGLIAMLPERDFGVVLLWNSESAVPSGLLPTIVDRALGMPAQRWLDVEFDEPSLYVDATPTGAPPVDGAGAAATRAKASPE